MSNEVKDVKGVGVPGGGTQKTGGANHAWRALFAKRIEQIKSSLNEKYGSDTDQVLDTYDKLMRKMLESGVVVVTDDEAVKAINDLEGQLDQLMEMLSDVGLDQRLVRNWISKVIDKQMGKKGEGLEIKEGFNAASEIYIGRDELYSLVNACREDMGFFERQISGFPVREVTGQAFDALFGDKNHRYDRGSDDVSLAKFTYKMKNDVLVFAGSVSSDALEKTLDLFSTRNFFFIDRETMAHEVKLTLCNLAMDNITKNLYPPSKDSEAGNREKREFLLRQISRYYYDTSDKKLMINAMIMGTNKDDRQTDESGNVTEKAFDYFKGCEKTILVQSLAHVLKAREKAGVGAVSDDKEVYYLAGLATLCGERGLIRHIRELGGTEREVYSINIDQSALVSKALIATIVKDFGMKKLGEKYSGVTYYGPDSRSLRAQIKWLKNKEVVEKEVTKVDRENPEVEPPVPEGTPIPEKTADKPAEKPAENTISENR